MHFCRKAYIFLLLFSEIALCYIELPLIRRQQLQGTIEVNNLNSGQYVSNNDSATGLCFLTLDLKNCSAQDNLGTVIGLGTPPQIFHVQVQFFSDYLWVFDWSCKLTGCGAELPKSLFDRSLSNSFTITNNQLAIRHQTLRLTATQVTDIATLGNSTWPLTFGLVQRAPVTMDTDYDGVFGVGPTQTKQSLLNVLLADEFQKIITIFVRDKPKQRGQEDGRLTIGKLDTRNCEDAWQYTQLSNDRTWKIIAKNILFGNTTILGTRHEIRLNPGSLITFAPKWVAADFYERLGAKKYPNSNLFVVRSSDLQKLPPMRFDFGSAQVDLNAEHYTAKLPVLTNDLRVVTVYGFYETPTWQLGDQFFRAYCAAIDLKHGQIGFAQHRRNPPSEEPLSEMTENSTNRNLKLGLLIWMALFVSKFTCTLIVEL